MAKVKVEKLEDREQVTAAKASHVARLIAVLGDGREWAYSGICNDLGTPTGKCSCGHPIRYEYIVTRDRDNQQAVLGSECINYFAEINPDTFAALTEAHEGLLAKLAEAKKAAKAAQQAIEVEAARQVWQAEKERAKGALAEADEYGKWLPYDVYYLKAKTAFLSEPPEYQRACDLRKWYERAATEIKAVFSRAGEVQTWGRRRAWGVA